MAPLGQQPLQDAGDVAAEATQSVLIALSSKARKILVEADSSFAFDLHARLAKENPGENLFFSPYSMSNALLMAAEGARGQSARESSASRDDRTGRENGRARSGDWKKIAAQLGDPEGRDELLDVRNMKRLEHDPVAANVWFDQQLAAGTLDGRSLDGKDPIRLQMQAVSLYSLIASDPAAATRRMSDIPPDQREDFDHFDRWAGSIEPAYAAEVTGTALALTPSSGKNASFDELAGIATDYHAAGAGEDILVALIGQSVANEHVSKAKAREVAMRITDQERRKELLEQLK